MNRNFLNSWLCALVVAVLVVFSVSQAAFVPVYRGGICVADSGGTCVGGDIRAEAGLGAQVGFMKDTADFGTVPVYQSTCYSTTGGACAAWGLGLAANGSPVGYLATTAPDSQSANAPLIQSNGLLLQGVGGPPSAFLWTTATPAVISGTITRANNNTPISGALVEVFQGTTLVGYAMTDSVGAYSIAGLASGTYTIRVTASGFVPQVRSGVTFTGSSISVNLSANQGIAIHSPWPGNGINEFNVLVVGQFDNSLGTELGINVNGYVALRDGDDFAALVPVNAQTTSLTATVTDGASAPIASHTIPVTAQPPSTEPVLFFRPAPVIVTISQPVTFTLTSLNPISQIELDGNGDGIIDFVGNNLNNQAVSFTTPAIYYPTVRVTEPSGITRNETSLIQVLDQEQLNSMLLSKWQSMKNALRQGNVALAVSHIVGRRRATYQTMLNALTVPYANIDQVLANISFVEQRGIEAEYRMTVVEGGFQYSYLVLFAIDEDGVWRIKFF